MNYKTLPKWAKKQALEEAKRMYLELNEEARASGENVPQYTDKELTEVAMCYLNDIDYFEINDYSYEQDGTDLRVEW